MSTATRCFIAAIVVLTGCAEDSPPAPTGDPAFAPEASVSRSEVKLVDHLDAAQIESPLLAKTSSPVIPDEARVLFATGFDNPRDIPTVLRSNPGGRISPRPDNEGSGLRLAPTKGRPVGFMVPAEPGRFYRVRVRASGARPGWTPVVMESRGKVTGINRAGELGRILPKHTQAGSHVNLDLLLTRHVIDAEETYDWQELELRVFTRQATRSLVLAFEAPAQGEPLWVDDIEISALSPSFQRRLRWVSEKYGGGLESYGQLLTLPDVRSLQRGEEHSYSYRHGILAPAPTTLRWTRPLKSRLSVGLGLLRESPDGAIAKFEVTVDGTQLLSEEIRAGSWKERTIDLTPWAGKEATLTLEATAAGGEPIAVWSNPVLWEPRSVPATHPPDVYLIAVDTLRADRMSVYGYERETTPKLDAFAADAVVFENAIAASNWTPESFASLFTSKYSAEHGVTQRNTKLAENTWAKLLQKAGYATEGIAYKLLLYDMGFEDGFDEYFNVPLFHLSTSYTVRAEHNWARAREWLKRGNGRRQFTFIHFNDPHQPFNHLEPELSQFAKVSAMRAKGLQMPILIRTKSAGQGPKQKTCGACRPGKAWAPWFLDVASDLYDGEVAYVDRYVHEVLNVLKRTQRYDDSLIIFLSDHGEGLGDHRDYIGHGFSHLFEEQIRVPLLIKPPARAKIAPRRVSQPVSLVDVLPTVLDLVEVEEPADLRGRSLVPLMKGEPLDPLPALSENFDTESIAARSDTKKLVLRFSDLQAKEWFYDLEKDPKETNALPLAASTPERSALRDTIARHVSGTHSGAHLWLEGKTSEAVTLTLISPAAPHLLVGRIQGAPKSTEWRLTASSGDVPVALIAASLGGGRIRVGNRKDHEIPASSLWSTRPVKKEIAPGLHLVLLRRPSRGTAKREGVSGDELQALEALGYVED